MAVVAMAWGGGGANRRKCDWLLVVHPGVSVFIMLPYH